MWPLLWVFFNPKNTPEAMVPIALTFSPVM